MGQPARGVHGLTRRDGEGNGESVENCGKPSRLDLAGGRRRPAAAVDRRRDFCGKRTRHRSGMAQHGKHDDAASGRRRHLGTSRVKRRLVKSNQAQYLFLCLVF